MPPALVLAPRQTAGQPGGSHESPDHGPPATAAGEQRDRLKLVLALTLAILAAEIVGGVLAHSLVLIADAGHMATDTAGIGLSLLAVHFAARPASDARTFGYLRAEILAAVTGTRCCCSGWARSSW